MATCGEQLIKLLENYGISSVFGIPGVHTIELYRGLKNSSLQHVTPRHEQGAGFMADGYARASGQVAACFIITGPGMTNIATAMGQALADSIPMLIISSVNRREELGMGEGRLHELPNQQNLVAGLARFSHRLMQANELPRVLARAFALFQGSRPGPVHIEIPTDVLAADASHIDIRAYPPPQMPGISEDALRKCLPLIQTTARPLIVLGGGAQNAGKELIKLAESMDAPVINTVNAKGVVPYSHPLAAGGSASCKQIRDELKNADLVLAVGTEFGETDYDFFYQGDIEIPGTLIRIDIDPAQLTRNLRADVAICGDALQVLQAINSSMATNTQSSPTSIDKQSGSTPGECRAFNLRRSLKNSRDTRYQQFFDTLRDALPDLCIVGDSTQPTYYAWLHYETEQPRKYFHSASGFGTLGYAIPAAIGAKLARPDQPVIGLIGDGAAQFTIAELASAVEAGVPVIFLIWNNRGYGEIKRFMRDASVEQVGVDIHTPDFVALGHAFGCSASRVENHRELKEQLIQANKRKGPTLIELREEDFADGLMALG